VAYGTGVSHTCTISRFLTIVTGSRLGCAPSCRWLPPTVRCLTTRKPVKAKVTTAQVGQTRLSRFQ